MAPDLPVLRPTGTGQIAPDDALHRQGFTLAHQHGAAFEQVFKRPAGRGKLLHLEAHQVVGGQVRQVPEPEGGQLGEDTALVGDGLGHHHVEGGDAVRGHQEQFVPQVVNVPHLALVPGTQPR